MSTMLDPTNKGKSMSGIFDPGGKIVKKLTGSDIAQRVADPLNILPKDTPPPTASELQNYADIRKSGQTTARGILGGPSRSVRSRSTTAKARKNPLL